jgi:hypothetical protein
MHPGSMRQIGENDLHYSDLRHVAGDTWLCQWHGMQHHGKVYGEEDKSSHLLEDRAAWA